MPNVHNTIVVGKQKGGYRDHFYRDSKGRFFKCWVLSQQAGPVYTIRILSRVAAGMASSLTDLTGIAPGTAKTQTNVVFPAVLRK